MNKYLIGLLSAVVTLALLTSGVWASEPKQSHRNTTEVANQKITERVNRGFSDFKGVTVKKVIVMKDESESPTKSLVILQRKGKLPGIWS